VSGEGEGWGRWWGYWENRRMRKNIYYCNHMQSGKIEGEEGGNLQGCLEEGGTRETEGEMGDNGLSSTLPFQLENTLQLWWWGLQRIFHCCCLQTRFSGKEIKCSILVIQHCSVMNRKLRNLKIKLCAKFQLPGIDNWMRYITQSSAMARYWWLKSHYVRYKCFIPAATEVCSWASLLQLGVSFHHSTKHAPPPHSAS